MQPPQHNPSGPEPQGAPLSGQPLTAAEQELSKATQVLVESSNLALRQSSEKRSLLEAELGELRTCLEGVSANLAAEREQRIVAEAQLAAHLPFHEAGERQLELVKRMEAALSTGLSCTNQQPPALASTHEIRRFVVYVFLSALGGAVLGAGVALLWLQIWWPRRQASPPALPATAQLSSLKAVDAGTKSPPPARNDTLHLRCDQPCWLDVRDIPGSRVLLSKHHKGRLSLQIGTGLDVFTARGDRLKIRINNGPETSFSKPLAGKRTFLPPKT